MINSEQEKYDLVCAGDDTLNQSAPDPYGPQLKTVEDDIATQQGGATPTMQCKASGDNYCIAARLVTDTGKYYCIDSTGQAGATTTANPCPTASSTCGI